MSEPRGVFEVTTAEADRAVAEAARIGVPTFVLAVGEELSRASFFSSAKATFPLDPPIHGDRNWDALSDSLFEGLHQLHANEIVIDWRDAGLFKAASPADFAVVIAVIKDVVEALADLKMTVGRPTQVRVYLEVSV